MLVGTEGFEISFEMSIVWDGNSFWLKPCTTLVTRLMKAVGAKRKRQKQRCESENVIDRAKVINGGAFKSFSKHVLEGLVVGGKNIIPLILPDSVKRFLPGGRGV